MARWTGEPTIGSVLAAAASWRQRCFEQDGSVFTDTSLWTAENFEKLFTFFNEHQLMDSRSFFEKLEEQMADAPSEVIKLAAECYWVLILFPFKQKMLAATKIGNIRRIWKLSGDPLPDVDPLKEDSPALAGVGNTGMAFNTGIPSELAFLIAVMKRWKEESVINRQVLLTNDLPWAFVNWLDAIEGAKNRPTRNSLL